MDLFGRKRRVKLKRMNFHLLVLNLIPAVCRFSLTSKDELNNVFSCLLLGLMYVVLKD